MKAKRIWMALVLVVAACDSTAPGPVTVLEVLSQGVAAEVGREVSVQVRARDVAGAPVDGARVTFTVVAGSGSVTPGVVGTGRDGVATVVWMLGTGAGDQTLRAEADGVSVEIRVLATPGGVSRLALVAGDAQQATVGFRLAEAVIIAALDRYENPVPGVAITLSLSSGGGTLDPSPAVTDASGRAAAVWTLGTVAGVHTLTARATDVALVNLTATARPDVPAQLEKLAGEGQSALINNAVAIPPSVRVADKYGNGVPSVTVTFTISGGGGKISGAVQVTDANGTAAVGSWVLGPWPGSNVLMAAASALPPVTFAAAAASGYSIAVRYVGSVSARMQEAVGAAADKWTRAVIGDVADASITLPAGSCAGVAYPALREVVDDLLIFVQVVAIDGPGKTLGSSAPCYVRSAGRLPILGGIKLDAADVSQMDAQGTLADVVVHEMGHILGIGTLWSEFSLLVDAGTSTVSFTGTRATDAFHAAGGSNWLGVPVENTGGTGTRDSHWRESSLGNELMTGFINLGTNPLSAVSIASLADLSYTVDLAAADGFTVARAAANTAPASAAIELVNDVAREPLFEIDPNGVVRPVQPR